MWSFILFSPLGKPGRLLGTGRSLIKSSFDHLVAKMIFIREITSFHLIPHLSQSTGCPKRIWKTTSFSRLYFIYIDKLLNCLINDTTNTHIGKKIIIPCQKQFWLQQGNIRRGLYASFQSCELPRLLLTTQHSVLNTTQAFSSAELNREGIFNSAEQRWTECVLLLSGLKTACDQVVQ